jgi:hypothetical protein
VKERQILEGEHIIEISSDYVFENKGIRSRDFYNIMVKLAEACAIEWISADTDETNIQPKVPNSPEYKVRFKINPARFDDYIKQIKQARSGHVVQAHRWKPKFDSSTGNLKFQGEVLNISKGTIEYQVIKTLFEKRPGERVSETDIEDSYRKDFKKRTLEYICRNLNKKIEDKFGIVKFCGYKRSHVWIDEESS